MNSNPPFQRPLNRLRRVHLLTQTAMCELVLNLRAPKSSCTSLSELYTLRKLDYHRNVLNGPYTRPLGTQWNFQARWKELAGPLEWDDPGGDKGGGKGRTRGWGAGGT